MPRVEQVARLQLCPLHSSCGLGSLVVALNALGIDPGRLWKGPWRWFSEELLDCCVPLAEVQNRGLDVEELACLARCNGADVELSRGDATNLAAFRAALAAAATGEGVLVVSYDRSQLGQTGSGHFSPVGGYHGTRDLALILDVARFKYPPHWVSVERLWEATHPVDPATGTGLAGLEAPGAGARARLQCPLRRGKLAEIGRATQRRRSRVELRDRCDFAGASHRPTHLTPRAKDAERARAP